MNFPSGVPMAKKSFLEACESLRGVYSIKKRMDLAQSGSLAIQSPPYKVLATGRVTVSTCSALRPESCGMCRYRTGKRSRCCRETGPFGTRSFHRTGNGWHTPQAKRGTRKSTFHHFRTPTANGRCPREVDRSRAGGETEKNYSTYRQKER